MSKSPQSNNNDDNEDYNPLAALVYHSIIKRRLYNEDTNVSILSSWDNKEMSTTWLLSVVKCLTNIYSIYCVCISIIIVSFFFPFWSDVSITTRMLLNRIVWAVTSVCSAKSKKGNSDTSPSGSNTRCNSVYSDSSIQWINRVYHLHAP